jgi:hypothetical protein
MKYPKSMSPTFGDMDFLLWRVGLDGMMQELDHVVCPMKGKKRKLG